jgi:hypothetical protein
MSPALGMTHDHRHTIVHQETGDNPGLASIQSQTESQAVKTEKTKVRNPAIQEYWLIYIDGYSE